MSYENIKQLFQMYIIFAAMVRIKKKKYAKAYWPRTFGSVYIKRYICII